MPTEPSSRLPDNKPKQVIVIRKDLGMRKGKFVSQGAHASLNAFFVADRSLDPVIQLATTDWLSGDYRKITLGVTSLDELQAIARQASDAGLPVALIRDNGLTEFKEPTYTALAIGPAPGDRIDPITAHLKLL